MKRILTTATIILVIILVLQGVCRTQTVSSQLIKSYVKHNIESLEKDLDELKAGAMPGKGQKHFGYTVTWWASKGIMEYEVSYHSPSISEGTWRGFRYYEGEPAFREYGLKEPMEYEVAAQGDGLLCREIDGDDWEYIEKISDYWYYYEVHC